MYQNTERCVEGKESDGQDGGGKGYLYPKELGIFCQRRASAKRRKIRKNSKVTFEELSV